jgi:predicted transcriptional regulator of viral defense system
MQYIRFRELFKDFTVFSLNEIKNVDSAFHRRRLNEWQEKGYIKKIVKGYYVFSETILNESVLFEIANKIYAPSYISFEMALSFYHLIPEGVYTITSATGRCTHRFKTSAGEFIYRTLKPNLFFGYNIIEYDTDKHFNMASPEKAILDYLYLNSHLKRLDDFESLRINRDTFFEQVEEDKLFGFLDLFANKSLDKRIKLFWEFMKHA